MSVNQGPGMGAHTVLPLFSENGMDFYGLDRMKSLTGVPISENGAWALSSSEMKVFAKLRPNI